MSEELNEALEKAQRDYQGAVEMLAHVLLEIGEPVYVSHEALKAGLPSNVGIAVEDDVEAGAFRFSLEETDGQ